MIFNIILCNLILFPLISCSNKTFLSDKQHLIVTEKEKTHSATKTQVLSEGGSQLPEMSLLTTYKDENTITRPLKSENSKNIEQHVKGRKGATLAENILPKAEGNISHVVHENLMEKQTVPDSLDNLSIGAMNNIVTQTVKSKSNIKTNDSVTMKPVSNPNIHKPTKTSYDELAIAAMNSSPNTAFSQLPPPRKPMSVETANSHPGMVIPVVITMLLVPVFAVLGYMALRKGQEAWKNRHYKRMDFLLDGMYNE